MLLYRLRSLLGCVESTILQWLFGKRGFGVVLLIIVHSSSLVGHAQADDGTGDGNDGAAPPGEPGVSQPKTSRKQDAGHRRSKCARKTGGRGGNAVDGPEHQERRSRIGEKNGIGWVGHGRKGAFPNDQSVHANHLPRRWKENQVRRGNVKQRVGDCEEPKESQCSQSAHNEREEEQGRNHGVHALDREDDADLLGGESVGADELEWQVVLFRIIRCFRAEKSWKHGIESHGMARLKSVELHETRLDTTH